MGESMQAAFIRGPGDICVERVPVPRPARGEVLLGVRAVGLCGSDLHYYLEGGIGSARVTSPLILGHEFAAEVLDPGAACALRPGTLVAVDPARSCGRCEWCLQGHPNLCPQVRFCGSPPDVHGALAECLTAPPTALFPVPVGLTAADAALLEPLGVALHAVDLAHLRPMESVAVLGAGPIGLLIVQVARLAGAGTLYAADPLAYRAELAGRLGADRVSGTHESVAEWTDGRGVDVVLEATDSAAAPGQATETVRTGGRVVLAGIPREPTYCLDAATVRRKGLTLRAVRRMKHAYPRALQMADSGRVNLRPLVTHRFPLSRAAEAFALQAARADGVIKTVVEV
ncbi:MAG: alcohol dehydrogenase catalytic domain-containing protein [Candidatus Latescibacterota bacterium]